MNAPAKSPKKSRVFGWRVPLHGRQFYSVVGGVDRTPAGNVAIRVGRSVVEDRKNSWRQTDYVVLEDSEALALASEISATVDRVSFSGPAKTMTYAVVRAGTSDPLAVCEDERTADAAAVGLAFALDDGVEVVPLVDVIDVPTDPIVESVALLEGRE